MGFNPWNCFGVGSTGLCKLPLPWLPAQGPRCRGFDEVVILDIAHAIAHSPLKAAGYAYVNLDCGYSTMRRDSSGILVVNSTRYPHGMPWLADKIHALGLRFGVYSSASTRQCCSMGNPDADDGSAGHEREDAQTFAAWGVDYLKHDDCSPVAASYAAMRDALNATGRPVLLSIHTPVELRGQPDLGNMWRTTADIDSTYESIMKTALENDRFATRAMPGAWNDPDMLEVGNFFTPLGEAEGRTQFSLWCLMKAPLLIGTDLTNASEATLAILGNAEAIAVNQDALGVQGVLRHHDVAEGTQVWIGSLTGGAVAVALLNTGDDRDRVVTLSTEFLPLGTTSADVQWRIRDIWNNSTLAQTSLPLSLTVGRHDVAFLVLSQLGRRHRAAAQIAQHFI